MVETRAVTGGIDTHAEVRVAAALDGIGGLLGVEEFPAIPAGYARLLAWLAGFGTVCLVGIKGTGSYGAGLARHLAAAGIGVVEVDRADRQDRRRQGKSDPVDAVSAARAAVSGRARGAPKGRDGPVEAIRALMAARRSARAGRTPPRRPAARDLIRACPPPEWPYPVLSAISAPARLVPVSGQLAGRLVLLFDVDEHTGGADRT